MTCENFTHYINTVNNLCGENVIFVMDNCNQYCLLSLVHLLDVCLQFLTTLDIDKQLENIVVFCANKNKPESSGGGHRILTQMTDFNINELMLFIVGCLGALGGLCVIIQRSKCETCCWGLIKRDVDAVIAEEKLQITGHTGQTPQPKVPPPTGNLKLELKDDAENK